MKIIIVILNLEGTWYDLKGNNNNNNNIETDYFHSIVPVKYIIPHACFFLCKSFERKL